MRLGDLVERALGGDTAANAHGIDPEARVTGVAQDSRRVRPGSVFVARSGERTDGHAFARAALDAGAVAIVGEASEGERASFGLEGAPYVRVGSARAAVARLAAAFFEHPSRALVTVGVTGTDGKTTTSTLVHHLLGGRYRTGLLSTAGIRAGDEPLELEGHFTTPEAPEVQGFLARFRDGGLSHAVVESSSHGFAQGRLDEVRYDVGVWTNLSPEHLDFHRSYAAYRDAKASLVRRARVSVLNADDPEFVFFSEAAKRVVSYGVDSDEPVDWRARDVRVEPGGLRWTLLVGAGAALPQDGRAPVSWGAFEGEAYLPMVGSFNVLNALAALAAAALAGVGIEEGLARLASFGGVPGRMQIIGREPFVTVVDFAHTPPALEGAIRALRPQVAGRILTVVGSAGERDPGKRAPLARVAVQSGDVAILTEEDHRSEDLAGILETMAGGAREAGGVEGVTFHVIPDRRDAIRRAVALARPGDLVLLAGKGHEATLERTGETLPWNEADEARRALAELGPAGDAESA